MTSKQRRGGADRGKESGEDGVVVDRKMIETIREATGATEDDIRVMLFECNYDANETTSRLIDNPFSQVQSKKDKKKRRDEDRKKDPPAKIVEVRRSSSQGGRARGHDRERGPRGERGERERGDKSFDKGSRNHQPPHDTGIAPEKPAQTAASSDTPAPGAWDSIIAGQGDASSDQPSISLAGADASTAAPSTSSALQPIAPPTQPAPIQPPGSRPGGMRNMADLFKKPQDQTPLPRPTPIAPLAPPNPKPLPSESGEANGWGTPHDSSEAQDGLRPGTTLGGVEISAPQKAPPSQISQPSASGSAPSQQQPVGSLPSSLPVSPGRHVQQDDQVSVPSTTGLGGVPVGAPPRQYADGQAQSHWMPKAPAAPGQGQQPTLGSSILSSLGAPSAASSTPLASSDLLAPASQGHQQPDLGLGASAFGANHSPVILPPSAHSERGAEVLLQGSTDLGTLNFQFGNFGLGGGGQDVAGQYGSSGLGSAFEPTPSSQLSEGQSSVGAPSSEPYRSSYSQPQNSLAQTAQQQPQHQRAYNAFNNAVQPQGISAPRPTVSANLDGSGSNSGSQALYGSQTYSSYGANQGYSQYQPPAATQSAPQYQNYNFQGVTESEQSSAPPTSHQSPGPKRPAGYDGYTAYSQQQQQQGQAKGDLQGLKYGHAAQPHSHLSSATSGASSVPSAPPAAAHHPLSQLTGYGSGQVGIGGMTPQAYGNYGSQQQYNNYPPQFNSYGSHPGSNYGYGSGAQSGYQTGSYGVANNAYGQNAKFSRNYGAAGGGNQYQQHGAGYGGQSHKQDKEHQALGSSHELYGQQQQLPLGAQQHYQGAGLRDHAGYGYQNPTQAYGGYGMGRQYNPPYYGRDQ